MKKILFTICLLAGITLGGLQAYSSVVDKSSTIFNPVYYRSFNDRDNSGLTMTYVSSTPGINGQGFKVRGIRSAYSTSNVTTLLQGSNNFTVAFAVKLTQEPTLEYVRYFTYSQSGSGNFFIVGGDNLDGKKKVRVSFVDDGNSLQRHSAWSSIDLPLNKWVIVTAEKDGGVGRVYFNNTLVASSTFSSTIGANNNIKYQADQISIGGLSGADTRSLTGNMDEVYVFNNNLTATQKTILYNQIKGSVIETSVNSLTNGLVLSASFNGTNPYLTNIPANPLVNFGSGNIEWKSGVIGQAYKSRGYNASANLILKTTSNIDILQGSNDFTVGFWIKPEEQTTVPYRIMGWLASGVNNNFIVYYGSGSPSVRLAYADVGSGGAVISDTYSLKIGRAEYIIAEKEGRTLRIYSNNNLVVSTTPAGTNGVVSTTTAAFYIGGNTTGQNFKGLLDEVKVYNRILTSKEKTILFNQTKGMSQGRQSTQLFAETFYNEADATTNNITLYNTPTFDNNGIKFNGVNQYAGYGSTIAYPATGFTWAFDVKVIDNDSSGRGIITGTTTAAFPSICMLNNKLLVYLQSSRYKYSALTFENGKKYRVVVTTDNTVTGTNIYINGVLSNGISSNSGTDPSPWSSLQLGKRTTFYFNGYIKNVKLYNRILTSAEAIKASKSPYFSIDK